MGPVVRPYGSEEDYWRMRDFLRGVFVANDRWERSWHVARLDYTRWHVCPNCTGIPLNELVFLWEIEGRIVALVIADGERGEAHFCIHPESRARELELEMIELAEERLAEVQSDGIRRLQIYATGATLYAEELLEENGYNRGEGEHQWRRSLESVVDVPSAQVPRGIRSPVCCQRGLNHLLERATPQVLRVHERDIKVAVENREGWLTSSTRAFNPYPDSPARNRL